MRSQTPTERPILAPASSNALNVASHAPEWRCKKRKSDVTEADDPNEDSFKAVFLSATNVTVTFSSIALIARACLPLAWLDISHALPAPVFEASIPSVQEWEQRVLVVRKIPNGQLYAVEKVGIDNYVACALHNWVSQEWCKDAATGRVAAARVEDLLGREETASLGHSRAPSGSDFVAARPTPNSPRRPSNRRGALARMSILTPRDLSGSDMTSQMSSSPRTLEPAIAPSPTAAPLPITPASQTRERNSFYSENAPADVEHELNNGLAEEPERISDVVTAEDLCAPERLRSQYFEHLYNSKTSLAFYVKGPLSRARAHVRSIACPAAAISELSDFYNHSILATKKIDLKYKESLSSIVKGLAGTGEQDEKDPQTKKKKRKKTDKLGKDCLWPDEEDFVKKWWRGRDLKSTMNGPSLAEELRKELADLRMRETKMQMLLCLEVMLLDLAAEKLSESQEVPSHPEVKVESIEDDPSAILAKTPQKQKPKKKRDLAGEIDTIVDRLCIWHTVAQDELGAIATSGNGTSTAKSSDSLRDFCKDVLLPFYSAKLPQQVKSISRKLGGPEISPKRPKVISQLQGQRQIQARAPATSLARSSSTCVGKSNSKSGQPQALAKRTLERVLSEDQAHRHASPPTTLSRSSTAPVAVNTVIPTLKREPSERPLSRGGMSMLAKSTSFSNREIDLVADGRVHEAKRRKLDRLAQQKRELEAAIEALRRPNRGTVAGAFMDEVEKRGERTKTVQITATPRARRFGDRAVHLDQGHDRDAPEPELPPMGPSLSVPGQHQNRDTMIVPSSTAKAREISRSGVLTSSGAGFASSRSSATKRAVLSAIHETPSRGMDGKTFDPLGLSLPLPRLVSSSDNAHCHDENGLAIVGTPAPRERTISRHDDEPEPPYFGRSSQSTSMLRSRRPVLFTSVKKSDVSVEDAFRDAPEIPERAGKTMDRVMGGKAQGLPASFGTWDEDDLDASTSQKTGLERSKVVPVLATQSSVTGVGGGNCTDAEVGDIYAKLGWDDDDFDI